MAPADTAVAFLDFEEYETLHGLLDAIPADFSTLPPGIPNCELVNVPTPMGEKPIYCLRTLAPVLESTELITKDILEQAHINLYGCLPMYSTLFCWSSMVCPSNCFPTTRGLFATRDHDANAVVTLALTQPRSYTPPEAKKKKGRHKFSEYIAGSQGDDRTLVGGLFLNPLWTINDSPHSPNVEFSSLSAHESVPHIFNYLSHLTSIPAEDIVPARFALANLHILEHFSSICRRVVKVMLEEEEEDQLMLALRNWIMPGMGSVESLSPSLQLLVKEMSELFSENEIECCFCTCLKPVLQGDEFFAAYNFEHSGTSETLDVQTPECLVKYIDRVDNSTQVGVFKRVARHSGKDGRDMVSLFWDSPYTREEEMQVEYGRFREDQLLKGRVRPYIKS